MAPPVLMTDVLAHLVSVGIVRDTPTGSVPRLLIEPDLGTPKPDGADETSAAIFHIGGIPARPREKFMRQIAVDFRIRSLDVRDTWAFHAQVRDELIDRQQWLMGSTEVLDCQELRELQRTGSDDDGFRHRWTVLFLIRA